MLKSAHNCTQSLHQEKPQDRHPHLGAQGIVLTTIRLFFIIKF